MTLGRVLYNSKEIDDAIRSFAKAHELDPKNVPLEKELEQAKAVREQLQYDNREVVTKHGSILISQMTERDAGPSTSVWECGAVLANYIVTCESDERPNGISVCGKSILELGGGTGVVGLTAAAYGACVCITDKEDAAIKLAMRNADANLKVFNCTGGSARVEQLDWTRPTEDVCSAPWDMVLGSDLVYSIAQIGPLRTILKALFLPSRPPPQFILAHKCRHDDVDASLLQMLNEENFTLHKVPMKEHHPEFRSPSVHVYRVVKRSHCLPCSG
eukprot:5191479-Pyramimonas_sp.AAC.1